MDPNSGITFTKTEYVENSGQCRSQNFKVLPTKEWKPKSFVVGKQNGKISYYKPLHGYVHGDNLKYSFRQPIQSLEIAGWGKDFRDRIFFSDGDSIIGQTKRNVNMFQKKCDFMNNLIKKIWVEGHNIWLLSQNEMAEIYSKTYSFNTERVSHYYHKEDSQLLDFVLLQKSQKEYNPVVITTDQKIKYLWKSEQISSQDLESQAVRTDITYRVPWVSKPNTYNDFNISFQNGSMAQMKVEDNKFYTSWSIQGQKEVPLSGYKLFDITQTGKLDIMAGFKGGNLEYYQQNLNNEYELLWGQNYGHSALDIDGGEFGSLSYKEFLVSSDTGKIYGIGEKVKRSGQGLRKLNTEVKKKKILKQQHKEEEVENQKQIDNFKDLSPTTQQNQIKKLKEENEKLQENLKVLEKKKKEQDDLRQSQIQEQDGISNISTKNDQETQEKDFNSELQDLGDEIVLDEEKDKNKKKTGNPLDDYVAPNTDVEGKRQKQSRKNLEAWVINHDLSGNEEDGSLELMLISEHPIHMISISCEIKDIQYQEPDSKEAKISINEDVINKHKNCVIHLLKEDVFEYTVKMFLREGIQGNFKVFVVSQNNQEFAQHLNLYLNPLFLHKYLETVVSEEYLPNSLTIQGNSIGTQDIYFWFNSFIPDFELQADDKFDNVCFENPFTQSYILIKFDEKQSQIVLHSDSISTIYSLKNLIQEDTNMKGKQVDMRWDLSNKSLKRNLKFLRNKLREHKRLLDQKLILDGLNDLNPKEEEQDILSEDFKSILNQKEEIEQGLKNLPQNQQYLKDAVVNLYSDYSRLQQIYDYEDKIDQLRKLLDKYKYKQIFELMNINE